MEYNYILLYTLKQLTRHTNHVTFLQIVQVVHTYYNYKNFVALCTQVPKSHPKKFELQGLWIFHTPTTFSLLTATHVGVIFLVKQHCFSSSSPEFLYGNLTFSSNSKYRETLHIIFGKWSHHNLTLQTILHPLLERDADWLCWTKRMLHQTPTKKTKIPHNQSMPILLLLQPLQLTFTHL